MTLKKRSYNSLKRKLHGYNHVDTHSKFVYIINVHANVRDILFL